MKLKTLVSLSLCASATVLIACGAEPDGPNPEASGSSTSGVSLEEALANLPQDFEGRAAALDDLSQRFTGDPRLMAVVREFEADNTPALLRRVEHDDGRYVSFVAFEGGGVVMEGGPRELPSLTAELGLTEGEPAALWRALVPDEPVPASIAGSWEDVRTETPGQVVTPVPEQVVEEGDGVWHSTDPSPPALENHGGIGTKREALWSESGFLAAGGCALQPTPGGAMFGKLKSISPWCHTNNPTGDGFVETKSAEVRARIHVWKGGTVNLRISRSGTPVTLLSVPLGHWGNWRAWNNPHSESGGCRWVWKDLAPEYECTTRHGVPTLSTWRVELMNATGDNYFIGGVWFDSIDSRVDAQPWP